MFFRFILRALQYRKQRLLLAFSALAVAATLATVLFGIYGTVEQRLHDEFRAYGANIVAVPTNGGRVSLSILDSSTKLGAEATPFYVRVVPVNGRDVPLVGVYFGPALARMTTYWHVTGTRDIGTGECLAGEVLANQLKLSLNEHLVAGGAGLMDHIDCVIKGLVSTGASEDDELIAPFADVFPDDVRDGASVIEIRAPGDKVEQIRTALATAYPNAQFRTVQSVAGTENNVILKIRAALFLLTLLILTITTLCVSSNFSEMVIERSKEIGILKALGAAEERIAAFFISESAALALLATIAGYTAGLFAAAAIARQIFGGAFHIEASSLTFVIVAAVMLSVAGLATALATSRIWNIQAAIILRGE